MSLVAFLKVLPSATTEELIDATTALKAAGIDGVGFLDAEDLGTAVAASESSMLATLAALKVPGIGVIGSESALYGYPFQAARRFATLDHLSDGLSGWLMRTTTGGPEAQAYDWRSAGDRLDELGRAGEFADIEFRLWESWEDGAQWPDKESGNFKDDTRIHPINYRSERFQVEGPIDVPPSPQGRPVVFAVITSPTQIAVLAPWVDVALVRAGTPEQATALIEALRADGRIPKILIVSDDGSLSLAEADSLAQSLAVDGIAPFIDTTSVSDAAALAHPAERDSRTLAERLGLSHLPVGGRTA